MRPEDLLREFISILETCFPFNGKKNSPEEDYILNFSESEAFQFLNILGEELGIDLALVSNRERDLIRHAFVNKNTATAKSMSSLLWLVYYGDIRYERDPYPWTHGEVDIT